MAAFGPEAEVPVPVYRAPSRQGGIAQVPRILSKFLGSNAKVAKLAPQKDSAVADFDYTSPAELFIGKGRGSSGGSHMTYRRFPTSAEAIKYAVRRLKPIR